MNVFTYKFIALDHLRLFILCITYPTFKHNIWVALFIVQNIFEYLSHIIYYTIDTYI